MSEGLIFPVGCEIDSSVDKVFSRVAANAEQTSKRIAKSLSEASHVQAAHRAMQASAEKCFGAIGKAAMKAGQMAQTSAAAQVAANAKVQQSQQKTAGTQIQAMQLVAAAQSAQLTVMTQQYTNYANAVIAQQQRIVQGARAAQANIAVTGFTGGGGGGRRAVPAGLPGNPNQVANLITGSQINAAFNRGMSNVAGAGREVAQGMGLDTSVASSMQRNLNVNREATQLAIQGNSTDVKGTAAMIESEARKIALETGGDVEKIVKGLRAFQAYTGDLAGGMDQLRNMAASSVAYDTPIEDMASLYAVITKYMGKEGTKGGVDALVRTIAMQGRAGAVEIKDQIKQDPKILVGASNFAVTPSQLKAFGGDKKAAQAAMALGLMQGIMGVSGESAQQSGNAVKSFMDTLSQKNTQEGMKKHGIDLFMKDPDTGKKVFKPLTEILAEASAKMQKDPTFAREMMGNVRGRKVMQAFAPTAMKAYDESLKGGMSEEQATLAAAQAAFVEMNQIAAKFQEAAARQADVQNFLASEAGQAAQMQARMRETFDQASKKIIESVYANMPKIEKGMEALGGVLGWAAAHPVGAGAAMFAAPVAQQVAANALSSIVVPALTPALGALAAALGPVIIACAGAAAAMGLIIALMPETELGKTGWWESNGNENKGNIIKDTTLDMNGGTRSSANPYESNLTGWDNVLNNGNREFGNWVELPGMGGSLADAPADANAPISAVDLENAFRRALVGTPVTVGNMPSGGGPIRVPGLDLGGGF